jgi:hypothetical protein
MSQPVKISDELSLDARLTAEIAERSIAGQIEFWAQLGRAIEPLLEGYRALALRRADAAVPLSGCLALVDSAAGRQRVVEYLESRPFPHYQPVSSRSVIRDRILGGRFRKFASHLADQCLSACRLSPFAPRKDYFNPIGGYSVSVAPAPLSFLRWRAGSVRDRTSLRLAK